jgi:uncharacterized membrane protein YkgB
MQIHIHARHLPSRATAGTFILNAGLEHLSADEETANYLYESAKRTYPFLGKLKAKDFTRLLAATEITLGAALLVPILPAGIAGAGLTAFSGALLGMYATTPGMRKEGSIFPTQQGILLFKDTWMLGMGLNLVLDDVTDRFFTPPHGARVARKR